MPAPRAKLHKVGLSPRQSRALSLPTPTRTDLMRVGGFTKRQADELLKRPFAAPDPVLGGGNPGGYTLVTLIKRAGFTRRQAQLILATS